MTASTPRRLLHRLLRRRAEMLVDLRQATHGVHAALDAETTRATVANRAITEELAGLRHELGNLRGVVEHFRDNSTATTSERLDRIEAMLDLVRRDEPGLRRQLLAARSSPAYAEAFTDPLPLVSIVIPTHTRWQTLRDRALPSVLNQSYRNIEVIVVGDAAPPETRSVIEEIADDRVVFHNLTVRGPYPEDPAAAWFVKGVPPFNLGVSLARGQWLCPFADDDILRPDAIEKMLQFVRSGNVEFAYGQVLANLWNGQQETLGTFPPQMGGQGLQGALIHASLSFIQQELGDALFRIPSDWAMTQIMLRIGVRIGYYEQIVAEWFQTPHPDYAHLVDEENEHDSG